MEEPVGSRGAVVYFCPSRGDDTDVAELYHQSCPPTVKDGPLAHVYDNIRKLLNQDQGDFGAVFMGSDPGQCLEKIKHFTAANPTACLVECSPESHRKGAKSKKEVLDLLEEVTADYEAAQYTHPLVPYALITKAPTDRELTRDDADYLDAGAMAVIRSPFGRVDVFCIVAHIIDCTRPNGRLLGADMPDRLIEGIRNNWTPVAVSHRPDETLPAERRAFIEECVDGWHFIAQGLDMDELAYAVLVMLERLLQHPDLQSYAITRPELMTFILATRRQYRHERDVHYHNWRHAVDVTQCLYYFVLEMGFKTPLTADRKKGGEPNALEALLSPMDCLTLVVSGIGHDVGHPGVNNAFLVSSGHALAQIYNEKSVLENYHCAAYSQLMRRHWPSLFTSAHFRAMMISVILATDMQRHFEYMGYMTALRDKVAKSHKDLSDWQDKDREQAREHVMSLLIKAADISNVARPFDVSHRWARVLMNEFARQGDLESELNIPTCLFGGPPDKEDILAVAQGQKGFMGLFGLPLFQGLAEIVPSVSATVPVLQDNRDRWEKKIEEETQRRKKSGDSTESSQSQHYGSVSEEQVEEAREEARSHKRASDPDAEIRPAQVPPRTSPSPHKHTTSNGTAPHSQTFHQSHRMRHPKSEQNLRFLHQQHERPQMSAWRKLPAPGVGSRRSSKDVALSRLQELSLNTAQPTALQKAARRKSSADVEGQILHHQSSYPNSRGGSKDESLTAILVTSSSNGDQSVTPSAANNFSPPTSPHSLTKYETNGTVKSGGSGKGQGGSQPPKFVPGGGGHTSVPSSRSKTTSLATVTSERMSPSTLASSFEQPTENGEPTRPLTNPTHPNEMDRPYSAEDWSHDKAESFWTNDNDSFQGVNGTPRKKRSHTRQQPSYHATATGPGSTDQIHRPPYGTGQRVLRESRSMGKLKGLKFWKKKRDGASQDGDSNRTDPSFEY